MEGLAEAIRVIQNTARDASAAQILDLKDPDNYHVRLGDEIVQVPKLAEPRRHTVCDMPSFCLAFESFHKPGGSVWHNHERIVAILQDDTRRDKLTLDLRESDQLQALKSMDRALLDQRTFCRDLKLRLGVEETFVGQFRRLDWQHKKEASGTSARGQDRMGISISDEVNGVADLPEELTLEIPIYDLTALPYRYKVPCLIEIDASQQKLGIVTKPDAITIAIDQAQHDIHDLLNKGLNCEDAGDAEVFVFYGSPS